MASTEKKKQLDRKAEKNELLVQLKLLCTL